MLIPDPTFSIPDPICLHPGSTSKNLSILTPKQPKKKRKFWPVSDPDSNPGSGSGESGFESGSETGSESETH
jgi:hypothetical protein